MSTIRRIAMSKKKKPISRLIMSDEEIANRASQYASQFEDYQNAYDEMVESCRKFNTFIKEKDNA
jgi:hypothetical protein